MSSPSEPDEMVSTSMERSFLPSFMTEPLPNWRSIWESAAERALVLSMEDPSTIRRAVADIVGAPYGGGLRGGEKGGGKTGGVETFFEKNNLSFPFLQYFFFSFPIFLLPLRRGEGKRG